MRCMCGLLAMLSLSGGCANFSKQPRTVLLQHPETLDFVECRVGRLLTNFDYARNEECVAEYQKQGYVVWDQR